MLKCEGVVRIYSLGCSHQRNRNFLCGGNATFRKASCIKPTAMEFVYVSSTHETPAGWLSMVLGEVARNSTNMALCRFRNGKQYNCDLNASYNIGARYFIREYLKPIPETEWSLIMAKVPELERRTNCTLSTLFSLYAVLNCQSVSVSESWPHGGNESGA